MAADSDDEVLSSGGDTGRRESESDLERRRVMRRIESLAARAKAICADGSSTIPRDIDLRVNALRYRVESRKRREGGTGASGADRNGDSG